MDIATRFWAKVNKTDSCWLWTATKKDGYGKFSVGYRMVRAHRFAYEMVKGPIPEGLQIDHLCRVPGCVNPDHLEAVTPRENTLRSFSVTAENARRTHCIRGHALSGDNVRFDRTRPSRICKACRKAAAQTRKIKLFSMDAPLPASD